jgi:hypothetical protein
VRGLHGRQSSPTTHAVPAGPTVEALATTLAALWSQAIPRACSSHSTTTTRTSAADGTCAVLAGPSRRTSVRTPARAGMSLDGHTAPSRRLALALCIQALDPRAPDILGAGGRRPAFVHDSRTAPTVWFKFRWTANDGELCAMTVSTGGMRRSCAARSGFQQPVSARSTCRRGGEPPERVVQSASMTCIATAPNRTSLSAGTMAGIGTTVATTRTCMCDATQASVHQAACRGENIRKSIATPTSMRLCTGRSRQHRKRACERARTVPACTTAAATTRVCSTLARWVR